MDLESGVSESGLRRRRGTKSLSELSSQRSGPTVHRAQGPEPRDTTFGVNVLEELDLRNHGPGAMVSSVLGSTTIGPGLKTHAVSASMYSVGDETTHLRMGSFETSSSVTPTNGTRLVTAKANGSVLDARVGNKTNFGRVQGMGVEVNAKLDTTPGQRFTSLPTPSLTVRPYVAAMEVGMGGTTSGFKLPFMKPDFEVTGSAKVRASIGHDLVGRDKSAMRIPFPSVGGDLKVKVSGGVNMGRVKQKTE